MKIILIITVIALLVCVLVGILYKPCLKTERQLVHHDFWIQYIVTSSQPPIMMPIVHPEYDAEEDVCVQRQ